MSSQTQPCNDGHPPKTQNGRWTINLTLLLALLTAAASVGTLLSQTRQNTSDITSVRGEMARKDVMDERLRALERQMDELKTTLRESTERNEKTQQEVLRLLRQR